MTDLHHHFHTAANELSLSANEKSAMRRQLLRAMRLPAGQAGSSAVPSPYFNPLFIRGMAAFALILVVGAGSGFAAEGTVPGDVLYSMKTGVTEPLRSALAVSDEQKASWNTSLVERRALEAETLTSEGRLSEADAASLTAHIEASADAARSAVEKVAETDADDADALSVELNSSVSAHGALLSELRDTSDDERTKTAASNFTNFFRNWNRGGRVAAAPEAPEPNAKMAAFTTTLSIAADTGTEVATTEEAAPTLAAQSKAATTNQDASSGIAQLRSSAERAIEAARNRFESLRDSLDDGTVEKVEDRLSRIEQSLEDAEDSKDLSRVVSDATTLNTFLSASSKLNRRDLLTPVIQKWNTDRGNRNGSWGEDD